MILQTTGSDWSAISTRSRLSASALARASAIGTMPICSPSEPIRRQLLAVISSFVRARLPLPASFLMLLLQCNTTASRHILRKDPAERLKVHGPQILAIAGAHGHGLRFDFFVPDHEQIGNTLNRVLADFKADLLVSQVRNDTKALVLQGIFHTFHIIVLLIGDIE